LQEFVGQRVSVGIGPVRAFQKPKDLGLVPQPVIVQAQWTSVHGGKDYRNFVGKRWRSAAVFGSPFPQQTNRNIVVEFPEPEGQLFPVLWTCVVVAVVCQSLAPLVLVAIIISLQEMLPTWLAGKEVLDVISYRIGGKRRRKYFGPFRISPLTIDQVFCSAVFGNP